MAVGWVGVQVGGRTKGVSVAGSEAIALGPQEVRERIRRRPVASFLMCMILSLVKI
jgi:hypothetical protein